MASTACGRRFDPQRHRSTPIAGLVAAVQSRLSPCYPDHTQKDLATVLSYLAGWISAKEEMCNAMERPRTNTGDVSATADNVRKAAANLGTSRAEPRKRLMALTILRHHRHSVSWSRSDTSVGWRCRWGCRGVTGVGIRQLVRRRFELESAANSLRQRVNWFQRRAFAGSYSPLQNAEILPSMSLTSSAKWSFR